MNHNDNPIKVIKTDASGTKQTIGELFPNQLPYQTITIDVKPICVAFHNWVKQNYFEDFMLMVNNSLENGENTCTIEKFKSTDQLFDIFIKEYKP